MLLKLFHYFVVAFLSLMDFSLNVVITNSAHRLTIFSQNSNIYTKLVSVYIYLQTIKYNTLRRTRTRLNLFVS